MAVLAYTPVENAAEQSCRCAATPCPVFVAAYAPMTLGCLSIQPERSRFFAQSGIEVRGFTPTSAVCLLLAVIMVWMPLKRSRGGVMVGVPAQQPGERKMS